MAVDRPTSQAYTPCAESFDLVSLEELFEPPAALTPSQSPQEATERPKWQLLTPSRLLIPPKEPLTLVAATVPLPPASKSPTTAARAILLPSSPAISCSTDNLERVYSPVSPTLSTSALSPTAPAFARRIPVKKLAEPLSFFSSGQALTPPPIGQSATSPASSSSSPEAFRHVVRSSEVSPVPACDLRSGLGFAPTPVVQAPYTYHGDILVARGVQHRQLSLPVSRPVRITRQPAQSPDGPEPDGKDAPRSNTPPSSAQTVDSVLSDDVADPETEGEPNVTPFMDCDATADHHEVARLTRSLSEMSIISDEGRHETNKVDEEGVGTRDAPIDSAASPQITRDLEPAVIDPNSEAAGQGSYEDLLHDLADGGKELRDHVSNFFARFDENVLRLRGQEGPAYIPSTSAKAREQALRRMIGDLRARIQELEQEKTDMKEKAQQARTELVVLELEKKAWVQQKSVLGQKYVELEASVNDLSARAEQSDSRYNVVLLEGEPRMASLGAEASARGC